MSEVEVQLRNARVATSQSSKDTVIGEPRKGSIIVTVTTHSQKDHRLNLQRDESFTSS